jgi:hypothetical protein
MPELFTSVGDQIRAQAWGISLAESPGAEPELASSEDRYNAIILAYQKLDDECAHVHQVNRALYQERDQARALRNALLWSLAAAMGVLFGVIFHG